ncbi:hypothetical protein KCP77_08550 [Salmonella enterica subsp. enterica]|nr:hypothetical protein KCP77_08550 [Salmonella enterica subsp. enterica]
MRLKIFAGRLLEDPVEVPPIRQPASVRKFTSRYYRADNFEHKVALLKHLLKTRRCNPFYRRLYVSVNASMNWLKRCVWPGSTIAILSTR